VEEDIRSGDKTWRKSLVFVWHEHTLYGASVLEWARNTIEFIKALSAG
jgi:hypothetical protein